MDTKTKNIVKANIYVLFFLLVMGIQAKLLPAQGDVLAQDVSVATPSPTPTTAPAPTPVVEVPEVITVKISHYWPPLGGVNCLTFKDGKCISKMANGKPWEDYVNKAIACPKELKLGTKIKILGKVWTCMDRGGMIVKTESGAYWVDMLTEQTPIAYGTEIEAVILK